MSTLHVLRKARAATQLRAVPRASRRHLHLTGDPLVVCMYTLAGEPFAPLAFVWGTDPQRPSQAIAYEPRNRDQRYAAIHDFAAGLGRYLAPRLPVTWETTASGRAHPITPQAPQIVVPNLGTQRALCHDLGRSLRYRRADGPTGVSPETRWAGAHLTWFDQHTDLPGQAIVVAATAALSHHWATGQADVEDENLATVLAWITNDPDHGLTAMDEAETTAYGPHTDPDEDDILIDLVTGWNRARTAVAKAAAEAEIQTHVLNPLTRAYHDSHRAIAVLRTLPEAAFVAARWAEDQRAWAWHAGRCEGAEPPRFTTHPRANHAVADCASAERRMQQLAAETAYSDPLIMAEYVADGVAITGVVEDIDVENREVKPGNSRRSRVPLVTLHCTIRPPFPMSTRLWWAHPDPVVAQLRQVTPAADGWTVVLALIEGHKSGSRVPAVGSQTVYSTLNRTVYPQPHSGDDIPWTHQPARAEGAA